jgi:hypothetical protein
VIEVVEGRLVQQFVTHPTLKTSQNPVQHRLARRDKMLGDTAKPSPSKHRAAALLAHSVTVSAARTVMMFAISECSAAAVLVAKWKILGADSYQDRTQSARSPAASPTSFAAPTMKSPAASTASAPACAAASSASPAASDIC